MSDLLSLVRSKIQGMKIEDVDNQSNLSIASNFGCTLCPRICPPQAFSWIKPLQGCFKTNSNASLDKEGGGIGGVIRDNNGFLVSMFSANVEVEDILALEIHAVLEGLQLAAFLGIDKIWMEVDSKSAADVINGISKIPWRCFHRIQEIHQLLSLFLQWRISHIWREGNSVADFLSKRKCPCKGTDIPPFLSPPALLQLLDTDRSGIEFCRM
ncbi:uncharacterized protein LOC143868422 [Tasmannia lanceolata]|uniref:uncharacterized protein LOC143865439 n=1 Tax=Tasmannia lanceolata TaxID=3420 RepID=UPI004063581B